MYDFEYQMNTYERVLYEVGQAGMTEYSAISLFDIHAALKNHFGSISISKQNFKNTVHRKEYFSKTDIVEYVFTPEGYAAYDKLYQIMNSETNRSDKMNEFFKLYLDDEIHAYINETNPAVVIDYDKLCRWDVEFADELLDDSENTINYMENSLLDNNFIEIDLDFKQGTENFKKPTIEIINLPTTVDLNEARKSKNVTKFIQVLGRVSLQNESRDQTTTGAFQCLRCDHITYVDQPFDTKQVEPPECGSDSCRRNGPYKLLPQPESVFIDTQIISLESPKGQVSLKVALQGYQCQPPWVRDGKMVKITGILKHSTLYTRGGPRSDFEYVLLANSIRFADESKTLPPNEEEIKMFQEWVKDPADLRYRIIESIAPHIHGFTKEKDALSLTAFSDWTWDLDPEEVVVRSSIHVLLLGDPGVAKSQMMKDMLHIAPKSKYGQIVGSTPGGLANSAIQKDGDWFIKAGLFSHADQGVMGLDEIDKFRNKEDINCMINVLEEQSQVVSKAGITEVQFNGRTAVIATANPNRGKFNRFDPILDQTDLPIYIMQRFDLIFVILDTPNSSHDAKVAHAVYEQHKHTVQTRDEMVREIDSNLLRKYILYARTLPVPELPESIEKLYTDYYVKLRGRHKSDDDPLISARSLNNLFRVARSIARRELSTVVTEAHAKHALDLINTSIQSLSFGVEDHSVMEYGSSKSQRDRIKDIRDAIEHICKTKDSATIADIVFVKNLDQSEVEHSIQTLKRKGELIKIGAGYRLV